MRLFLNVEIINIRECWKWSECWMKFQSMCKRFVSSCEVCDLAADRFSFSSVWCDGTEDMFNFAPIRCSRTWYTFNFIWNRCGCYWKRWHSYWKECKLSCKMFVSDCCMCVYTGNRFSFFSIRCGTKEVSFIWEKRSIELFLNFYVLCSTCEKMFKKNF